MTKFSSSLKSKSRFFYYLLKQYFISAILLIVLLTIINYSYSIDYVLIDILSSLLLLLIIFLRSNRVDEICFDTTKQIVKIRYFRTFVGLNEIVIPFNKLTISINKKNSSIHFDIINQSPFYINENKDGFLKATILEIKSFIKEINLLKD